MQTRGTMFRLATSRPVAVMMITSAVALFGLLSYRQLGLELMPDLAYPTLTIRTAYPGAAPEEVETEITRDIESRVGTVEALVGMQSSSRAGSSEVILEFDWDTDMDKAAQRVRERLGRMEGPREADPPLLLRYDPALVPVMRLGLAGEMPLTQLRVYAEEELSPELAKIEGVAAVRVVGGLQREVHIRLSPAAIAARGLSVDAVANRLAQANVNLAGGTLKEGSVEFLVRTLAELRDVDDLRKTVVYDRDGIVLRLEDVAEVVETTRERVSVVRVDGQEGVRIDVFRQAGANIVDVCDRVRDAVFGTEKQQAFVKTLGPGGLPAGGPGTGRGRGGKGAAKGAADGEKAGKDAEKPTDDAQETGADAQKAGEDDTKTGKDGEKAGKDDKKAGKGKGAKGRGGPGGRQATVMRRQMTDFIAYRKPAGSELSVLGDQSVFIRAALSEVQSAALVGGILAVLILYLFLRSGYSTLIIAVAIPLSIAVTFAPLLAFGVTLNVMSLGGLALGVGMLVDNSVVVLESIFRCREEGDDVVAAAVRGTREVGGAVIASTLTTVAVFFPIVFVEGVAGQVFGDLALAVVCSLLASLFVALFVVPMLASRRFGDAAEKEALASPETPRRPWVRFRALPRWWGRRKGPWWAKLTLPIVLPYALLQTIFEVLGNVFVLLAFAIGGPLVLLFRLGRKAVFLLLWPLAKAVDGGLVALRGAYRLLLRGALKAPLLVVLVMGGLGAAAWTIAAGLGAELIPDVRQGVLEARVELPVGTPLGETAARVARLETRLRASEYIERVEAFVGEPEAADDDAGDRGPHTAALTLQLVTDGDPARLEAGAMAAVRAAVGDMPDARLELTRPALFSLRPPIRVVILGHTLPQLETASRAAEAAMAEVGTLSDIRSSVEPGYPELQLRFDRLRLSSLGLDPRQVAERVRGRIDGEVATALRGRERPIDVRVRLDPMALGGREDLASLIINPGGEVPIPLEAVAEIDLGVGPAEIRRVDSQRAAVLTARVGAFDLGGASQAIGQRLAQIPLPEGFEIRLQGQDEEMQRSLESLGFALMLAIFLVYVVMASQFESLRAPLVIMGSLPLAAIGVFLVLGVLRMPLSVVVFVGLITLAGIVVNNAIVLVDYARQLQRRGLGVDEALIEAGMARLRPILMTTLTTVLGLIPLALDAGDGAELRRPIAVTLIAGLVFATGLTLVVIPVLYRWIVGESIDRRAPEAEAGA